MITERSLRGTIDRRILVNYRIDPVVLQRRLPEPFVPDTVNGFAIGGICLIRLCQLRPPGLPAMVGMNSENAAHRFAVQWPSGQGMTRGVYITRRDTSSRVVALVGGRLFPGAHHRARVRTDVRSSHYEIDFTSVDGSAHFAVVASASPTVPKGSVFASLAEASEFFERAPVGYSTTHNPSRLDGVELSCRTWAMRPLEVSSATSSLFNDASLFPQGSIELDSGFIMEDIDATWRASQSVSVVRRPSNGELAHQPLPGRSRCA
jgi:hypothetical protein